MTAPTRFAKDLSRPEPIPEAGIARADELMRSGRLHRYGETGPGDADPALLEEEFAASIGARYCVAMNSCGATLFVALKTLNVQPGDTVLTSSFTLAPVPGAIAHAGARAVLVETGPDLATDLDDLDRRLAATGARVFLVSHMRGHIADLERVRSICDAHGAALVEDCAHTMGAAWAGRPTGRWGRIGCFSTQTYKHINSGEGGLLVTDDDDVCARAILYSGSYMFFGQHRSRPADAVFDRWRGSTPNFSMRMTNHAAAMLRPQLAELPRRAATWNRLHARLAEALRAIDGIAVPARDPREAFVASSIQFFVDRPADGIAAFVARCAGRGLHVKWFGAAEPAGFTSNASHWHYLAAPLGVSRSLATLARLCDLRIPLDLDDADCRLIGDIVAATLADSPLATSGPSTAPARARPSA